MQHLFRPAEPLRDPMHAVEAGSEVQAALATLAPRVRACVVLRFFDDLTVPQIARQLGIAEGTVKRYLSDAQAQLALALGPLDPEVETTTVEAHTFETGNSFETGNRSPYERPSEGNTP